MNFYQQQQQPVYTPTTVDSDVATKAGEQMARSLYDPLDKNKGNAHVINKDNAICAWNGYKFTGIEQIKKLISDIPNTSHNILSLDSQISGKYTIRLLI